MDPQQYCHQVCKKSKSNFVYTFYLLGRKRRHALEAFYAFCRLVDDSVDEAPSLEKAKENLKFWRQEIEEIYGGTPRHLVSQALAPAVKEFAIPKVYLQEIVAGCEMDLTEKIYLTFARLEDYCFCVASCVGLVTLHILGVQMTPQAKHGGIALGKALQLTNIVRDVTVDLEKGRIYLPQEDLQKFHVTQADLENKKEEDLNIFELLCFEIGRARYYYREAWDLLPKVGKEKKKMLPAVLMGRLYEGILNKIEKDPSAVLREKISLTTSEKLKITARVIIKSTLSA